MLTRLSASLLFAVLAAPATAQLRLPTLPVLPVSSTLQALPTVIDRVTTNRQSAIDRLVNANRRLIDLDPNGSPIVRSEVLALSPSVELLKSAESSGFVLDRSRPLGVGDLLVVIFKCPPRMSAREGINRLRELDPSGTYDFNHLYSNSGVSDAAPSGSTDPATDDGAVATAAVQLTSHVRSRIRVGLLDTGIDTSHPDFHDSQVHGFGCGDKSFPAQHGTAVASLLVSHASADLYAADVYCGSPTGGAVDAIIAALAWMTQEQVAVINVSLVGPKNVLLERATALLIASGHVIVAAVGNDGPTAPPLYPAAYPNVIGVTGVDAHRRVLLEALRGPQVMFAAPGADITAANTIHTHSSVRGTSFAAPCVAALLAQTVRVPDSVVAQQSIDGLVKSAIDLGTPGKDLTYGFGFLD